MQLFGLGSSAKEPQSGSGETDANIIDVTTQTFMDDVIQASMNQLVLVDFWAPWCGPCKQLTPIIEKVTKAAKGQVRLAKMNIDEEPQIPGQLGVQSIPAVFAFKDGRPVDAFMGVQSESQVTAFVERHAGPLKPAEIGDLLAKADENFANGEFTAALDGYFEVMQLDESSLAAMAGMIKCNASLGETEAAQEMLDALEDEARNSAEIKSAEAMLEMALKAANLGELQEFEDAIQSDPENHEARAKLAEGLAAKGQKDEAITHLLKIFEKDREWDDDGARKRLLDLFEAWGPKDPATLSGRRKLSSMLFS